MSILCACNYSLRDEKNETEPPQQGLIENKAHVQLDDMFKIAVLKYEDNNEFIPCFSMEYSCYNDILLYSYTHDENITKYGFMDTKFNILTNPISDTPSIFLNDLAYLFENGEYKIINKNMEITEMENINLPFEYMGHWYEIFSIEQNIYSMDDIKTYYMCIREIETESGSNILIPQKSNSTNNNSFWGYTSIANIISGNYIDFEIEPVFEKVKPFSSGLAAIKNNGKWGFIDSNGQIIIPCEFTSVSDFYDGLSIVSMGDYNIETGDNNIRYGVIDKFGSLIVESSYYYIDEYRNGYAKACTGKDEWTFLDKSGKEISLNRYYSINDFSEGYALVLTSKGYGFLNENGSILGEQYYELAKPFHNDYAPVKIDGRWGFIDKLGSLVIEPEYHEAFHFSEGLAFVSKKINGTKQSFLIDINNKKYLENFNFSLVSYVNSGGNALAYTQDEDGIRTFYIISIQ